MTDPYWREHYALVSGPSRSGREYTLDDAKDAAEQALAEMCEGIE